MKYTDFFSELFRERYGGASKERGIWYHGTSMKRVPLILSRGLDPNISPKNKSWGDDPDTSPLSVDRTSYGGVYVTQNIMTALSSAYRTSKKDGAKKSVVVLELQPRSLTADEDDFTTKLRDLKGNLSGSVYHSIYPYMWEIYGAPGYHKESHEEYKNGWVDAMMKFLFSLNLNDPRLRERVKKMLEDEGYKAMLTRMVSYVEKGTWGDWWEWRKAYADVHEMGNNYDEEVEIPDPPTKSEGERAFRLFIDKLTRTMKHNVRSIAGSGLPKTGRSLHPIGFDGKNRIVAIVELVPSKKYKYTDDVRVIYGELPEDFKNQWKERVGGLLIVK